MRHVIKPSVQTVTPCFCFFWLFSDPICLRKWQGLFPSSFPVIPLWRLWIPHQQLRLINRWPLLHGGMHTHVPTFLRLLSFPSCSTNPYRYSSSLLQSFFVFFYFYFFCILPIHAFTLIFLSLFYPHSLLSLYDLHALLQMPLLIATGFLIN